MDSIETRALEILQKFPIYHKLPASISGKYHIGETSEQHLKLTVNVMSHLCNEFNVNKYDRDMLLATAWLHDIGLYVITKKGKTNLSGWIYYEKTGYSRLQSCMHSHGNIGADILDDYDIPRKQEIQRLISVHMSHWYKRQPQPNNLYEYLICMADYTASRGQGIFEKVEYRNGG